MLPFEENFPNLPPFPDDVETAPLLRISLKNLLNSDPDEVKRFCSASEELGFFYLDLRSTDLGNMILADAEKLFEVNERLFDLSLEQKREFDFSKRNSYFGFKELGIVADRYGNPDRNEFYNVSKDDILDIADHWPAPDLLRQSRPLLKSFITSAHTIVNLLLGYLNDHLGLPRSTLADIHCVHQPSGDLVRFIKAPPQPMDDRQVALGEHSDFGSVTVLFNKLGGLQILPPGKDSDWCHVRPLPGHVIINLGDALVKFTNGLLRSNIHRVVSPPGAQANSTRYSLAYFSRPREDVILKRLDGSSRIPPLAPGVVEEEIKSKDWILRRGLGSRIDLHKKIDFEKNLGTELQSRRLDA